MFGIFAKQNTFVSLLYYKPLFYIQPWSFRWLDYQHTLCLKEKSYSCTNLTSYSRCSRQDITQHTVRINLASCLREWVDPEFLNAAWLASWGMRWWHVSIIREEKWDILLFQERQRTDSYLNLFICWPVSFLIMLVRENLSRQRAKEANSTCGCQPACLPVSMCAVFYYHRL